MSTHAVRQLLDELAAAYTEQDHERALGLFTDDITFVGTGQDELRFGRGELEEQIRRDLTQADALTVRVTDVHVAETAVPDHAWFYAHVGLQATVDGASVAMPMRLTGVAGRTGESWRFRQAHFSLPAGQQAEGESFIPGSPEGYTDVAARFRAMLAGDHVATPALYTDDALFDVNVPEWRFQLKGADAIRRQLDQWHPVAPELVEWRERTTEHGLVVEVAMWEGDDHKQYSRSLHDLEITSGGRIARHTMYCTGDWSKESLAEASAALIDA